MKIPAIQDALGYLRSVQEKKDGGFSGQQHPQQQKKKKEDEAPEAPVTREKLQGAVDAFIADEQTRANGLSAQLVEGGTPGLRVVLSDGGGRLLRQYTAEEFLKLRDVTRPDGRARGKLLDQKF